MSVTFPNWNRFDVYEVESELSECLKLPVTISLELTASKPEHVDGRSVSVASRDVFDGFDFVSGVAESLWENVGQSHSGDVSFLLSGFFTVYKSPDKCMYI
jgi:hypothetical protein